MSKYAIACGGTGGHLSPGIAIAEELVARGDECILVVSEKPIDGIVLKKYREYPHVALPAKPFLKGIGKFFEFAKSQLVSFFKCIGLLRKEKINCVIGMGGFTNAPVVMAAFVLGVKIVLYESNRVIGKSIRVLSRLADIVFLPYGVNLKGRHTRKKILYASMPIRRELQKIEKTEAKNQLNLLPNVPVVTVLGGSQGSDALNRWATQNFQKLNERGIAICCVRGLGSTETESKVGKSKGGESVPNIFMPFCDNMSLLLSATDLLVCRAGAGTIAEAAHFSLPMILVPYPNSADNHQEANAIYA
jgi:UDP-N-acetylglucosamine--N-acetylmuramyl-(pentapeptide) pyrophosphoryl-undecaprenol N-acetylglucosamine transferase